MLNFLPLSLKDRIISMFSMIYEVRLRVDKPICVKGFNGNEVKTETINETVTKRLIEQIVLNLCNYSIYSVEESLKNGFITSNEGERVGVCGTSVLNGSEVVTIKDFTSICIRVPNDVKGCSNLYYNKNHKPKNCLVISKPFQGKTTFIRDLGRNYAKNYNVLFIDERDELCGNFAFNLGNNADVIRYSSKKFGFLSGVRSYNPDVIVCDELMSKDDVDGVEFAILSGVKIIASVHADNLKNLAKKQYLSSILQNGCIDDIICLNEFKPTVFKEEQWLKSLCV